MMTFISLLALPLLAAVVGYALGLAAQYFKVEGDPLAEQIGALLPNGQCGQCGYPGCAQAAEAMQLWPGGSPVESITTSTPRAACTTSRRPRG